MPSLAGYVGGLRGPQLSVVIDQELHFLTPAPDAALPSDDPRLNGTVLLDLPSARAVKSITVTLEGACDVYGALSLLKNLSRSDLTLR